MEHIGASLEGEWSCLSGLYTNEEADFMAQLLWSSHDSGTINTYYDSISTSQESCYLSDSNPLSVNNNDNRSLMCMDFYMEDGSNTASYLVEGKDHFSIQEISYGNLQPDANFQAKTEALTQDKTNATPSETSKKRSRSSGDAQKSKRNVRSKKSQRLGSNSNNDEERNGGLNGPASSSDDESNGGSGKTRASRGAATDPQSLYARKRRERINERLRILQKLVPNGTKVDISTMLEEAVQYVKFLQLQIKLLSSDDLWMYAPIAYNGMDIGLDRKLTTS